MFQHVLSISNTLCLYVFSVCVCISVLGLCPARYMCLYVYELSCDNASVRNLKECVWFYNTIECVIHFQRTNSGIQFDRCEPSQRNVFIAVGGVGDFTVVVKPLFMSIYYPITNLSSVYT